MAHAKIAKTSNPLQGIAEGAMADSGFWKVRQAECERYAKQFPELRAVWNAYHGSWNLWWGSTPDGVKVPAEPVAALNDIAKKCTTQLPNPVATGDAMAELLDYLREFMRERKWYYDPIATDDRVRQERKWGFRITHHHPISELVWNAGVRIGKPPVQVRKDLNLSTGEEESDYRWLESGTFEHIFQALAVLFADLSGHAFESEAAESGAGRPNDVSARQAIATESSSGSHGLIIPKDSLGINPFPKGAPQHVAPTRRWSIVTGISGEGQQKKLRERFEQVVREALAELGYRFRDPLEAMEAWLDFLLRESAYSRGTAIAELGAASKHELAELKVLARESGNRDLAATLGRLEAQCEFPKSLHAILRVDVCMLPEDILLRAASEQATETPGKGLLPENADRAASVRDAIKLFELQPGFPEAQVWMRDRMSKLRLSGPTDVRGRAKTALSNYNIRAAAFHRLISTVETQNAFMVLLEHFGHGAWYEFTGIGTPIEIREGAPSIAPGITRRKQWWTRKGYKRLADAGRKGADRSGPSSQNDELAGPRKPEDNEPANVRGGAVKERYPKRAAWLETQLARRNWNVHDLQAQAGPDWKTARKILDGLQVSRSVLEKTAAALSKKNKQVLFRDIPQE